MSEVKWIKLSTEIFNDEAIELIEQMPEGDALLVVWFKLLVKAGQVNDNGLIYVKKDLPYSEETLAQVFKRPLNIIKLALATFQRFGMIEILTSDEILLTNWQKYQNLATLDKMREDTKRRVAKYREKQKQLATNCCDFALAETFNIDKKTFILLKNSGLSEDEIKEYLARFNMLPQKENDSKNFNSRFFNFAQKLHNDKAEEENKKIAAQKAAKEVIKERQKPITTKNIYAQMPNGTEYPFGYDPNETTYEEVVEALKKQGFTKFRGDRENECG